MSSRLRPLGSREICLKICSEQNQTETNFRILRASLLHLQGCKRLKESISHMKTCKCSVAIPNIQNPSIKTILIAKEDDQLRFGNTDSKLKRNCFQNHSEDN